MLKNVHLAPGWLMQLEKKLHSLQPHACFRLFLTMEINPKVGAGGDWRTSCPWRVWAPEPQRPALQSGDRPLSSGAREPAPSRPHLRV